MTSEDLLQNKLINSNVQLVLFFFTIALNSSPEWILLARVLARCFTCVWCFLATRSVFFSSMATVIRSNSARDLSERLEQRMLWEREILQEWSEKQLEELQKKGDLTLDRCLGILACRSRDNRNPNIDVNCALFDPRRPNKTRFSCLFVTWSSISCLGMKIRTAEISISACFVKKVIAIVNSFHMVTSAWCLRKRFAKDCPLKRC